MEKNNTVKITKPKMPITGEAGHGSNISTKFSLNNKLQK